MAQYLQQRVLKSQRWHLGVKCDVWQDATSENCYSPLKIVKQLLGSGYGDCKSGSDSDISIC